jgi:hypothetical protein
MADEPKERPHTMKNASSPAVGASGLRQLSSCIGLRITPPRIARRFRKRPGPGGKPNALVLRPPAALLVKALHRAGWLPPWLIFIGHTLFLLAQVAVVGLPPLPLPLAGCSNPVH